MPVGAASNALHPEHFPLPTATLQRPTSTPATAPPFQATSPTSTSLISATNFRWHGTAEGATTPQRLTPGLWLFHVTHPTNTPFAVFLLNAADDHLALLANASTPISGTQAFGITTTGDYYLHVVAQDGWSVDVAAWSRDVVQPFTSVQGTAMQTRGLFKWNAGSHEFSWQHSGNLGFNVVLWSRDGAQRIEIANANGAVSATSNVSIPTSGAYILMVMADGEWSVSSSN